MGNQFIVMSWRTGWVVYDRHNRETCSMEMSYAAATTLRDELNAQYTGRIAD